MDSIMPLKEHANTCGCLVVDMFLLGSFDLTRHYLLLIEFSMECMLLCFGLLE